MKRIRSGLLAFLCFVLLVTYTGPEAFAAETPIIPHCQHVWGAATYTWSGDHSTCTAQQVCQKNAAHKNVETVTASVTTSAATCTTPAETVYTATFERENFSTQIKRVTVGEATGHTWGEVTYLWSMDDPESAETWDPAMPSTCIATRVCANDPSHVETETVDVSVSLEGGKTTYTAAFTDPAFGTQTRTVGSEAPAVLWGDANGDGEVSNKDIVRLKNYFANLDSETGESTYEIFAGADANGDGEVTNKDIVRLKNYFANYDEETGLSTVTLGPAA